MGIGTSLGAFFEDSFQHHAGNEYLLNPNSTPDNNELSTNSVMPETPEPVDPSHYDTPLTQGQEEKFQDWKSKMAPNDSGEDYDLRGAFLNNTKPDEKTGHWPDTFKKPNHPTFSDQSMYAGERPDLAGRWEGDVYIPPLPITPIANLTNTPDEIMSGVEGVRAWQNRGVAGPTQMRRPANDNKKSGQIEAPEVYDSIVKSWNDQVSKHQRGNEILGEQAKLMDILINRNWSDLEKHKFNKLDKEHESLFSGRPD